MRKTVFAALLICALGVLAQAPPPTSGAPETATDVDVLHALRRSTVSLGIRRTENGVEHFVTIGSGVIVAWDLHNACLLTAKHVFYDPDKSFFPTILYLRLPQTEPRPADDLGVELKLVESGKNLWQGADDADLAVITAPNLSAYKDLHAIFFSDFGGGDDVYQGGSVVVMGYPELAGPEYQTTPIARGGIIAWTNPTGRLDHTFLVDANVFSGNSGGPVFHLPTGVSRNGSFNFGGSPKFIGIVVRDAFEEAPVHAGVLPNGSLNREGITNQATGEVVPVTAQVPNIGGIGIVEPASRAKKLIIDTFHLPNP